MRKLLLGLTLLIVSKSYGQEHLNKYIDIPVLRDQLTNEYVLLCHELPIESDRQVKFKGTESKVAYHAPEQYSILVSLTSRKQLKDVRVYKLETEGGSRSFPLAYYLKEVAHPYSVNDLDRGNYEIIPKSKLSDGEYAITIRGNFFTFSIKDSFSETPVVVEGF